MGAIGKLISTKIENYVTAIVQKKLAENKDGSFFSPAGDDSPPLPDDKIFMSSVDGSGKFAFLGSLMITQGAEPGEKILYSRDSSGAVQGKLLIDKTGKFIFNDGTLKTARDTDPVKVTIPAGTFIVSVSGGSGAPAVGVLNPAPIDVNGTIQDGTSEVLMP